jgi:hypothetical protein
MADDIRVFYGIASTPDVDSYGDMLIPDGVKYKLPIPLFFSHKKDKQIGEVIFVIVNKEHVLFVAKMNYGEVRADSVWNLILDGAINSVSVGFGEVEIKHSELGCIFESWELSELSMALHPVNKNARMFIYEEHEAIEILKNIELIKQNGNIES